MCEVFSGSYFSVKYMSKKNKLSYLYILFIAGHLFFNGGTALAADGGGLVKCGRTGQPMCTLCDLIVGVNVIINYILGIATIAAIAVIFIGAIMYVISGADPGLTGKAKSAIGNALLGIVIILSAWLLVDYTMIVIGRKGNLGIEKIKNGWNNFTCTTPAP